MDRQEIFNSLWRLRDRDLALLVSFLAVRRIDLMESPDEALRTCRRASEAGDPQAQHALAKLLWTGLANSRDDHAAFQWCSRASDQGYLPAKVMLAGFYMSGIGIRQDSEQSKTLLEEAAAAGSADATDLLGTMYAEGLGVERDLGRAIELWRRASLTGHTGAQTRLGNELIGSSMSNEVDEGVEWLRKAANGGSYSAHYTLGNLYEIGGGGLPKDPELAARHRSAAAALEAGGT